MAKRVDLREPKGAPRPGAPRPGAQPGAQPQRVLRTFEPGEVIRPQALTPMESAVLVKAGWAPGDPIPAELPKIVQAAQQAVVADAARQAANDPQTRPAFRPPPIVNFDDLPAEHQARIVNELAAAKRQAAAPRQPAPPPQVSPHASVNAALHEAMAAAGITPADLAPPARKPEPGYARPQPRQQPTPPPPPGATPASVQAEPAPASSWPQAELAPAPSWPQAELAPAPSWPQPGTPEPAPQPPHGYTGGAPDRCQHCGWRRDVDEPAERPSAEDRRAFLQALLGGIRYKKRYDFLGGRLSVTFRTLTTAEADLAFLQAAIDSSKVPGEDSEGAEATFMRTLVEYRMCLSLDSVTRPDGVEELPDGLDGWDADPPKGQTKLRQILPYVYDRVLPVESLRRAVGAQFFLFQRQVELMEARVHDPDFWEATEEQP